MKKKVLTTLSVILVLGLAALGILAYLSDTDSDVNVMTLGNVDIEQIEQERGETGFQEFSGKFGKNAKPLYPATIELNENSKIDDLWPLENNAVDKMVSVNNIGKSDAYVRTWFAFELGDLDLATWQSMVQMNIDDNAWDWSGGWTEEVILTDKNENVRFAVKSVTYNDILKNGESTIDSLKQVALHKDATNEIIASFGDTYEILAFTQAVQTEGFSDAKTALNEAFGDEHPWQEGYGQILYKGKVYKNLQEAVAEANANGGGEITIGKPAVVTEPITISSNVSIISSGHNIIRGDGYTGTMFSVSSGASLSLENVTVDGGAVWTGKVDPILDRGTSNSGVVATGNIIATSGNGKIVLNKGTVIQNNDGANAISLATRGGGSLTVNDAQIINNTSAAGAIWGGGNITINEGSKINGNHATSIGGAIRMVDGYNNITFIMNGGEMNHNKSDSTGGAVWGGNRATYIFNGGEMAYNSAATAGGAIWSGNYEKYTIAGDFKLHDNSAGELGGAIRFGDHASLTMTGGEVYNNTVNGESSPFFLYNNSATITGGTIKDNFSYSGGLGLTVGNADIDGVINFNLSTNHNTAYLAEDFKGFKFTVNESAANFSQFNFKPADGYVYTSGDENKLVCMNEGYETYWTGSVFKIKAK